MPTSLVTTPVMAILVLMLVVLQLHTTCRDFIQQFFFFLFFAFFFLLMKRELQKLKSYCIGDGTKVEETEVHMLQPGFLSVFGLVLSPHMNAAEARQFTSSSTLNLIRVEN